MKPIEESGLRWLLPGIRIKRYIVIVIIGLLLFFYSSFIIAYYTLGYSGTSVLRKLLFYLTYLNISFEGVIPPLVGVLFLIVSLILIIYGIRKLVISVAQCFVDGKNDREIMKIVFEKRKESLKRRVVVIGGGTGTTSILEGTKHQFVKVSAIITVADSGGSSGRIRREMKIPPPGDIRNCLVSLAEENSMAAKILSFRFREANSCLDGHNLGNIIIAGLTRIEGDFGDAVIELSKLLNIKGETMPFTTEDVTVCAEFEDGTLIEGEAEITAHRGKIKRIFIKPDYAKPYIKALERINGADLVVIGPGSLYTSIIPPLLFPSFVDTIRRCSAKKTFVVNIMTEPGETDDFTASKHVQEIVNILGDGVIDYAIVNTGTLREDILKRYLETGSTPVTADIEKIEAMGIKCITGDFILKRGELVRHDPEKISSVLMKLAQKRV